MGFANLLACCGASNVAPEDALTSLQKAKLQETNTGAGHHECLLPPDGGLPILVPVAATGKRPTSWASNTPCMAHDAMVSGYLHAIGTPVIEWDSKRMQQGAKQQMLGGHAADSQLPAALPAATPRIVLRVLGAQQLAVMSQRVLEALLPTLVCMPHPSAVSTAPNSAQGAGACDAAGKGTSMAAGVPIRVAAATSLRAAVQAAVNEYWSTQEQEQKQQEQPPQQAATSSPRNGGRDAPAASGSLFFQPVIVNPAAQAMLGVTSLQEAALQLGKWLAGSGGSGGLSPWAACTDEHDALDLAAAVVRTAAACTAALLPLSATGTAQHNIGPAPSSASSLGRPPSSSAVSSSARRSTCVVQGGVEITVTAAFVADVGLHGSGGVGPALALELAQPLVTAAPRSMPPAGATAAHGTAAAASPGAPTALLTIKPGRGLTSMDSARVLLWSPFAAEGVESGSAQVRPSKSAPGLPGSFGDVTNTSVQLLSLAGADGAFGGPTSFSGRPSNPGLMTLAGNVPPAAVPRLVRGVAMLDEVPVIATLMEFDGAIIYQNEHSRRYWGACSGGGGGGPSTMPLPGSTIIAPPGTSPSRALMGALFRTRRDLLAELLAEVELGFAWRRVLPVPPSFARASLSTSMVQRHNSSTAAELHTSASGRGALERVMEGRETGSSMSVVDPAAGAQQASLTRSARPDSNSSTLAHPSAAQPEPTTAAPLPPPSTTATQPQASTVQTIQMGGASGAGDGSVRGSDLPSGGSGGDLGGRGGRRSSLVLPGSRHSGMHEPGALGGVKWSGDGGTNAEGAAGAQLAGKSSRGSGRRGVARSVSFSASVMQAKVAAAARQDVSGQLGAALTEDERGSERGSPGGNSSIHDPHSGKAALGSAGVATADSTAATSTVEGQQGVGGSDAQLAATKSTPAPATTGIAAGGLQSSSRLLPFRSLDAAGIHTTGPSLASYAAEGRSSSDEPLNRLLVERQSVPGQDMGTGADSWRRQRVRSGVGPGSSSQSASPLARDLSMARTSRIVSTGGMAVEPSSRVMSLIGRPSGKPPGAEGSGGFEGAFLGSSKSFSAAQAAAMLSVDGPQVGSSPRSAGLTFSKSFSRRAARNPAPGSDPALQGHASVPAAGPGSHQSSTQSKEPLRASGQASTVARMSAAGEGILGLPDRVVKLTSGTSSTVAAAPVGLGVPPLPHAHAHAAPRGSTRDPSRDGGRASGELSASVASQQGSTPVLPNGTAAAPGSTAYTRAVAAAGAKPGVPAPAPAWAQATGVQQVAGAATRGNDTGEDIAAIEDLDGIQEGDFEGDFNDDDSDAAPVLPQPAGVEGCVCWHEVQVVPILDPVTGQQVMLLLQTDITGRAELEARMAALTESQLTMLEQMFPRHVLEFMVAQPDPSIAQPAMSSLASSHDHVSVLFTDIVGFTSMSKEVPPDAVMGFLNELFTLFDELVDAHQIYKVETAGDCYIAAGGLMGIDEDGFTRVDPLPDPAEGAARVLAFAKSLLRCAASVRMPHNGQPTVVRVGIHTGPVVTGLIGTKLPKYSLFGDTMNTASRMESTSKYGCIQVSEVTYRLLQAAGATQRTTFVATGGVEVKGKGVMSTFIWDPEDHPEEVEEGEEEAAWDMLAMMKGRGASRTGGTEERRSRGLSRLETDASHTTAATAATAATQAFAGLSRPASGTGHSRRGSVLLSAVSGLAAAAAAASPGGFPVATPGAAAAAVAGAPTSPGLALTAALLEALYAQDAAANANTGGVTGAPASRRVSSLNGSLRSVRLPGAVLSRTGSVTSRRSGASGASNHLSAISMASKAAGRQHPLLGMLMARSRPQSALASRASVSVTTTTGGPATTTGGSGALGGRNVASLAISTLMNSDALSTFAEQLGPRSPQLRATTTAIAPLGVLDSPAGRRIARRQSVSNVPTRTSALYDALVSHGSGPLSPMGGAAGAATGSGTGAGAQQARTRQKRPVKRSVTFSALMKNLSSKGVGGERGEGVGGTNVISLNGAGLISRSGVLTLGPGFVSTPMGMSTGGVSTGADPYNFPVSYDRDRESALPTVPQSPAIAAAVAAAQAQRALTKQQSLRNSGHAPTVGHSSGGHGHPLPDKLSTLLLSGENHSLGHGSQPHMVPGADAGAAAAGQNDNEQQEGNGARVDGVCSPHHARQQAGGSGSTGTQGELPSVGITAGHGVVVEGGRVGGSAGSNGLTVMHLMQLLKEQHERGSSRRTHESVVSVGTPVAAVHSGQNASGESKASPATSNAEVS